jgi:phosphopantothenoylcysteine decarboxylase/phosphopantothenate--cysteine ligase
MSRILVAVSGSIAAYKAADLVSALRKAGHEVRCLLTSGAREFVTPTVLETLSGNPVHSDLFGPGISGTEHIRLARWPDLMVFAPATAHLLAKLALGLADDLVSTVALASEAPWLIAPAMNTVMWEKEPTRLHLETLRGRGAQIIEPAPGTLACGEVGTGKLASIEELTQRIEALLAASPAPPADLAGTTVLITAGPTTSRIDAVRYLTNHSTGRMGAELAQEALLRGATVHYVLGRDKGVIFPRETGPGTLHLTVVETAEEMLAACLPVLAQVDGVIATAAVLDYRVAQPSDAKQKRAAEPIALELVPSVDVLGGLREKAAPGVWFVGFAAETDSVLENGRAKLERKGLDYLLANRVAKAGETLDTGFGTDTNGGWLLRRGTTEPERWETRSKRELARALWDVLARERRRGSC